MSETLTIDQKLKILSHTIDLVLKNGRLSGKEVKELYNELQDLIDPEVSRLPKPGASN